MSANFFGIKGARFRPDSRRQDGQDSGDGSSTGSRTKLNIVDENEAKIDDLIWRISRNNDQIKKCLKSDLFVGAEYAAILSRANAEHYGEIANLVERN